MADAKRLSLVARLLPVALLLGALLPCRLAAAAATTVTVSVCYPSTSPTLTAPADGTVTGDSSILMSGTATPSGVVYGFRNGTQVGFVTAAGDGSFSLSVSLVVGANELKASTRNACDEDAFSGSVTVERTAPPEPPVVEPEPTPQPPPVTNPEPEPTQSPEANPGRTSPPSSARQPAATPAPSAIPGQTGSITPVILEPRDGSRVRHPNILVRGRASPLTVVALLLNNQTTAEILTDETGAFAVSATLLVGDNRLEIMAGDAKSPAVRVTYEPIGTATDGYEPLLLSLLLLAGFAAVVFIYFERRHQAQQNRFWLAARRRLKRLKERLTR